MIRELVPSIVVVAKEFLNYFWRKKFSNFPSMHQLVIIHKKINIKAQWVHYQQNSIEPFTNCTINNCAGIFSHSKSTFWQCFICCALWVIIKNEKRVKKLLYRADKTNVSIYIVFLKKRGEREGENERHVWSSGSTIIRHIFAFLLCPEWKWELLKNSNV